MKKKVKPTDGGQSRQAAASAGLPVNATLVNPADPAQSAPKSQGQAEPQQAQSAGDKRQARLEAQLRENLQRRKSQTRARKSDDNSH